MFLVERENSSVVEEEEKGRKVEQEVEREDQGEETAHTGWPWR